MQQMLFQVNKNLLFLLKITNSVCLDSTDSAATGLINTNTTLSSDQTTKTSMKYSPNVIPSIPTTTITDSTGICKFLFLFYRFSFNINSI
jgi:hypothetical protein